MDLILVMEILILAVSATFVGIAIYKSRKAGNKEIPWVKIRPILTEAFVHIKEVQELRELSYKELEDYVVVFARSQILKASFLTDAEIALISDDLIRSIIGPRLKELYEQQGR